MKEKRNILFLPIVFLFCVLSLGSFLTINQINNSLFSLFPQIVKEGYIIILIIFAILFLINISLFCFLKKRNYILLLVLGIIDLALLICFIVLLETRNNVIVGPGFIIFFIATCLYIFVCLNRINSELYFSTKDMAEIGLFVGIAVILNTSFLKIHIGNNGGSISFAMIPLVLLCLRKNCVKSFISCGIIYGFVNCLIDGYGFISFPLDYLLAFGSLAVISCLRKHIIKSQNNRLTIKPFIFFTIIFVVAIVLRTAFHTLSGMIFYGFGFVPSLVYQLTYVGPSAAITLVVTLILLKPFSLLERIFPSFNS